MKWTSLELQAWLSPTEVNSATYRHLLLHEDAARRGDGVISLARLVLEAHRDAREKMARLLDPSLDPIPTAGPADSPPYPDALHTSVLQGYLGEILAGLIAENYGPHGRKWAVPAFLFRGHLAAFQDLERRRQLGGAARPVPGRTGDDALGFEIDEDGAVVSWLFCEAKCTHDHRPDLVAAGHEQLSSSIHTPVDLMQLIEILSDSADEDDTRWVSSLREMLYASPRPPRFDMFVYVCGRRPVRDPTWIPQGAPHAAYAGAGPLQAVEAHLEEFDDILGRIYPQHVIERG